MHVTVKLFAHFRVGRFKIEERQLLAGSCCLEVVEALGIDCEEIGVIMVNGRHASLNNILQEGDTLAIFPLVGGG